VEYRPQAPEQSALGRSFAQMEDSLRPALLWIGFLWWQFALYGEITRSTIGLQATPVPLFGATVQPHLHLLAWVGSAFVLHELSWRGRLRCAAIAVTPAWTVLPFMLLAAAHGAATRDHVFQGGGWIVWPLLVLLHLRMLRRLDQDPPAQWWPWVHAGGVWLLALLAGNLLMYAVDTAGLWDSAWASVILLVAGSLVVLLLSRQRWFEAAAPGWPLDRFAGAYLWLAAAPLVLALIAGALRVALTSNGDARPLPYLPLANPTDLAVALALGACALWWLRLSASTLPLPAAARDDGWTPWAIAIAFIVLNTVWLRAAHHLFSVPWDAGALFSSFIVQAGYSILWTLLALVLMLGALPSQQRKLWLLGAALLGATVLKLFVVDLSNRDGTERIFVFIAVGVLMLVVGYFAPLPPAGRSPTRPEPQGTRP